MDVRGGPLLARVRDGDGSLPPRPLEHLGELRAGDRARRSRGRSAWIRSLVRAVAASERLHRRRGGSSDAGSTGSAGRQVEAAPGVALASALEMPSNTVAEGRSRAAVCVCGSKKISTWTTPWPAAPGSRYAQVSAWKSSLRRAGRLRPGSRGRGSDCEVLKRYVGAAQRLHRRVRERYAVLVRPARAAISGSSVPSMCRCSSALGSRRTRNPRRRCWGRRGRRGRARCSFWPLVDALVPAWCDRCTAGDGDDGRTPCGCGSAGKEASAGAGSVTL